MDASKIISVNRMICASPFVTEEIKEAAHNRPDKYFLEYVKFHQDYNLLMPVIECLQSEQKDFGLIKESENDVYGWHTNVVIFNYDFRNIYWLANNMAKASLGAKDDLFNPGQSRFVLAETKIAAMHEGVSFFIERYNIRVEQLVKQKAGLLTGRILSDKNGAV